ncbi:MAG: hypothetical protein F4124_11320 [Acidimicrobiia bacterium]|nr:DUF6159 family protein [bacterium]MXW59617.1 hypothetical protein [Acidimicrobiia bacterium]MYI00008.1 hypothetical protein [Acidimicrobiia bacterium]MYJ61208.1 hypothetical protein [Acidimicrobiia bacterium]
MGRFRRTMDTAKASWAVLQHDRELAVLPILGALASIAVVLAVGLPIWLSTDGIDDGGSSAGSDPMLWIGGIIILFAVTVITVFFNAAVVSGARERFSGGDPTISSAIKGAFSRFHVIVPWAILALTVGMIIRLIQSSDNIVARILGSLLSMAWGVLTFLVVPILVVEQTGPFQSLSRSGELLRHTWGENLIAQVGFGIIGFVAAIPGIIIIALGASAGSVGALVAIVIGFGWIALVAVVVSTLTAIFQMALYLYATTGQVPMGFEQSGISDTFNERSQGPLMRGFGGGGLGGGGFGGGRF